MTLGRTLRWARHLRTSQVLHRLWIRARWPLLRRGIPPLPSSGLPLTARPPSAPWPGDAENGRRIAEGTIRLLGQEHAVGDWRAEGKSHLWRFTLHYFEWLADMKAAGRVDAARQLVRDWIAAHDRPDPLTWHPYPTSLRLVAWLEHADMLGADASFRRSLARQAAHLARVVERDVGGNHIVKNLKALAIYAVATGGDPGRWLAELRRELDVQILPDGCHYERSPAYHAQVLADLADLRRWLGPGAWLDSIVTRMAGALAFLRHPDGGLALFNDGHVGDPGWLAALDAQLPAAARPAALEAAGYYRLEAGPAVVLMDAGRCCPDELPAHAHADTLSLELSWGAERVVVNCGTFAYQDPIWRNRLRGTAAHSTVVVAGSDSAELFGAFRLGRRPRRVTARTGPGWLEGEHDGYPGHVHHRRLTLDGSGLAGEDRVSGPDTPAEANFHLHPSVRAEQDGDVIRLWTPNGARLLFRAAGARLDESVYAPDFGRLVTTRRIAAPLSAGRLAWRLIAE